MMLILLKITKWKGKKNLAKVDFNNHFKHTCYLRCILAGWLTASLTMVIMMTISSHNIFRFFVYLFISLFFIYLQNILLYNVIVLLFSSLLPALRLKNHNKKFHQVTQEQRLLPLLLKDCFFFYFPTSAIH